MQIFQCQHCQHPAFFENTQCQNCQITLGFDANRLTLCALQPKDNVWMSLEENQRAFRYCDNHQHQVCNWLIPADQDSQFCPACELNRYIPNLSDCQERDGWRKLELAKHRLVYSLLRFGLPLENKLKNPNSGLAFDFIDTQGHLPIDAAPMTGHADGQVTIATEEADSVTREQNRVSLKEHYRTLLGHLRHEVGHYYWDVFISENSQWLEQFRQRFGDEQINYAEALEQHYAKGHCVDWQQSYISSYAASHPWEDWAETWAHYLHMVDTLETAYDIGLSANPASVKSHSKAHSGLGFHIPHDPYHTEHVDDLIDRFTPLSLAANSLNRSMGQPDIYPFVITAPVREKLQFIHEVIKANRQSKPTSNKKAEVLDTAFFNT